MDRGKGNLGELIGGQLNPDWVEWLIGWPVGWSNIEPLSELQWLDWSVDPADGSKPIPMGTHTQSTGTRSYIFLDGRLMTPTEFVRMNPFSGGLIPRVTTIKTNRVNRLKAIGNGQVPQCAAIAWRLLTGDDANW